MKGSVETEGLKRFFVDQSPVEEQLAAEWSRIRGRLPDRQPRRRGRVPMRATLALAGLAFAGVVCVGIAVLRSRGPGTVMVSQGTTSRLEGPVVATLDDGSVVKVARRGRVQVIDTRPQSTHLRVEAGTVEFDVTDRPGRSFVVFARAVQVVVAGTRFVVGIDESESGADGRAGSVRVAVSRGVVEVAQPSVPTVRLVAGEERWFAPVPAVGDQPSGTAERSRSQDPSHVGDDGAPGLFERANLARRSGRTQEAASLYQSLLDTFPDDRRAGLAAMELGRLRMDALGDLPGAAQAFRMASRVISDGSLHEDAQARLVDALDALHDRTGCRRARGDYLARYRHGVHATAVRAQCRTR